VTVNKTERKKVTVK